MRRGVIHQPTGRHSLTFDGGTVALLGHRIGYSASPAIQNAAFAALGVPLRYELRDVPPAELGAAVAKLHEPDLVGANVTQPHKVAICEHVDELSAEVRRLGAANTVVRRDGRLIAHNTDLPALAAELRELLGSAPMASETRSPPTRRVAVPREPAGRSTTVRRGPVGRAVVLGAGGASRAAQAALADLGATDVAVVTRERWHELAGLLEAAELLINATPIGTASDESPVPVGLLRRDLVVLDLVYRPSPSALVRAARAAGAVACGGAGMLLRQAAASLTLWTGCAPPFDVMRAALRAELGPGAEV